MAGNSQHLSTEIAQQQRLIPLQVQYGRMLEMNGPEIEQEVNRALEEMPALEKVPDSEPAAAINATEDGEAFRESDSDMLRADYASDDDTPGYLQTSDGGGGSSLPRSGATYDPDRYVEPVVADDGETLFEALSRQIAERDLAEDDLSIALYIAGSLDENGYMTRTPAAIVTDLAINEGIVTGRPEVDRMWQLVRSLEPAGVGATDLRDCLLLQLDRLEPSTAKTDATELLTNHFELFSNRNFARIAKRTGWSDERLRAVMRLIERLNPKPGSVMDNDAYYSRRHAIVPDFNVEADSNGRLTVTLLNRIPELQIESTFEADIEEPSPAGLSRRQAESLREARAFIRQNRDDARNFIRILQMRNSTLFKVMEAIVKLQTPFFLTDDDEAIRPMVLRDVAELTGLDLSVISRAAQGKYVATAHGLYPLKKFFNEKPRQATDDSLTANRIIAAIRSAIEQEDPSHPLSDRRITEQLSAAGFDIARRTVAKYRENLGFPTARLRKKI